MSITGKSNPLMAVVAVVLALAGVGGGYVLTQGGDDGADAPIPALSQVPANPIGGTPEVVATQPAAVPAEASVEPAPEATIAVEADAQVAAPAAMPVSAEVEPKSEPEPKPELEPQEASPAEAEVKKPSFDVVRVEADGSALIAGRAEPNTTVAITADGAEIAEAETDARGQFVVLTEAEATGAPQELRIETEAAVTSDSVIVLVEKTDDEAAPEQAPIVIKETEDRIEVIQPAEKPKADQVTLDVISYDQEGGTVLIGRGGYGYVVRIYLNGSLAGQADILDDGSWTLTLPRVEPGIYTMRVDEADVTGRVRSRLEMPFKREDLSPEVIAEVKKSRIIVQPGNNLWTIAKQRYGEGIAYWQIFEANAETIRDPNLIYPGQVFALPDEEMSENSQ